MVVKQVLTEERRGDKTTRLGERVCSLEGCVCFFFHTASPQNNDDGIVDDGEDHDLQPDVIKLLCRID